MKAQSEKKDLKFTQASEAPSVFNFDDFREFLKVRLDWIKSQSDSFSLKNFSKACGFSGKSFLQFILAGKRNISSESTIKLAKGLQLTRQETAYFFALVKYNQETEPTKKMKALEKMIKHRALSAGSFLSRDSLDYVSEWYIPAIRELASLDRFKADPQWISENLFPSISVVQAKKGLEVLTRLKLLTKLPNGATRPTNALVDIAEEMNASQIFSFYLQSIEISKTALVNLPSEKREFGHLSLSLDEKRFAELKSEISEFRQRIFNKYGEARVSDDSIYQFNLQCFPVSRKI